MSAAVRPTMIKRARRLLTCFAVVAATVTASLAVVASASASAPPNNVGPYTFGNNVSVTCGEASGRLTGLTLPSPTPRAAMRPYWAKTHNGHTAAGQNVELIEILGATDPAQSEFTPLVTHHRYTLVGRKLTTLRRPAAFAVSAAMRSLHAYLVVVEVIQWLRPTDNKVEGSAGVLVNRVRDGRAVRGACPADHPSITTTTLPRATDGIAYRAQLAASGATRFTWSLVSAGGSGATVSSSGLLTAPAPTRPTRWTVTVRARETNGLTVTKTLTLGAVAPWAPPAVPTVSASASGPSVTYNWAGSTPGHGIHYYVILDNSGVVQDEGVSPGSATLNRGYGFAYSIQAYACDRYHQCSARSAPAGGRTESSLVIPGDPSCTVSGSTLSCSWPSAPSSGTVTYHYAYSGGSGTSSGTSIAVALPQDGAQHTFTVYATDSNGQQSVARSAAYTDPPAPYSYRFQVMHEGTCNYRPNGCELVYVRLVGFPPGGTASCYAGGVSAPDWGPYTLTAGSDGTSAWTNKGLFDTNGSRFTDGTFTRGQDAGGLTCR